jgi:hypothetical protein
VEYCRAQENAEIGANVYVQIQFQDGLFWKATIIGMGFTEKKN